jgi:hypothetical protein
MARAHDVLPELVRGEAQKAMLRLHSKDNSDPPGGSAEHR